MFEGQAQCWLPRAVKRLISRIGRDITNNIRFCAFSALRIMPQSDTCFCQDYTGQHLTCPSQ